MLGDSGLRNAELPLDDGDDITRRLRSCRQYFEYSSPDWIPENVQSVHHTSVRTLDFAGVRSARPFRRSLRRDGVGPVRDRRDAPRVAALADERFPFIAHEPGHCRRQVQCSIAGDMSIEPKQHRIPADANRTGAELIPEIVWHVGDVLETQLRTSRWIGGQIDVHPTHLPLHFPR